MPMKDLIQYRRGSADAWTGVNPVLYSGEIGYDTTNNEIRVGDGVTPWSGLGPIGTGTAAGLATKIPLAEKGIASGVATLDGSVKVPAGQIPMQDIADSSELSATFAGVVPTLITRDALGRISSVTENGVTESYTRDAQGQIKTVIRSGNTFAVNRTPLGQIEGTAAI